MSLNDVFSDYNYTVARNDSYHLDMVFDTLSGNLTDYKVWFYGKLNVNDLDAAAVIKLDSATGGITLTNVTKTASAIVPFSATAGITVKTILFCEWQVKSTISSEIYTVIGGRGKLTILPDVVRATT